MEVDSGEVIVLDLPFSLWAAQQRDYSQAFALALSTLLSLPNPAVTVTSFQASSYGTVTIFFDLGLSGASDYSVVDSNTALRGLFCNGGAAAGVAIVPGSPACAPLLAALRDNGVPVAAAFYASQTVASVWSSPPPAVVNASRIGTYPLADVGEAIVLNIPYSAWAVSQQHYRQALQAGLAAALNRSDATVVILDFQQSTAATVIVYFDVVLFGHPTDTSSAAVGAMYLSIEGLFADCHGTGDRTGCASLPGAQGLLAQLKAFGLPTTNVTYNAA